MSPSVPLVAGARLPLAFVGLGLLSLLSAAVVWVFFPTLPQQPMLHPHLLAWVHLWLPGFLLSVCFGAVYQLMPVVLGRALRLPLGWAWAHLLLHAVGLLPLVLGFARGDYIWVATGGVLIAAGSLVLAVAIYATFLVSTRRDVPAWSFPFAGAWLSATVLAGVVMAVNRHASFLPTSAISLIKAHAHLGLIGFFLTLLQGTSFQLIPMFTMGTARRLGFAWTGLLASQLGLIALACGLALEHAICVALGSALIACGVAASGYALVATTATRRRKKLEPGLKAFGIGAVCVLSVVTTGGWLVARGFVTGEFDVSGAAIYLLLAVMGVLGLTVLGMLCKIIPFLVWMRAYGSLVGKRPVPLAPSLGSHSLETAWLVFHVAGLLAAIVAVSFDHAGIAAVAAYGFLAGVACFGANVVRIVRHLWIAPKVPAAKPLHQLDRPVPVAVTNEHG